MTGHFRHNATPYIIINSRLCQVCGQCSDACPNGVIGQINLPFHKHARIDKADKCTGCQLCVKVCPEGAIIVYRTGKQGEQTSQANLISLRYAKGERHE